MYKKIGFGGGCHWCTEAVFASLKGIQQTEQGWIASLPPNDIFSEAVIVSYDEAAISLREIIEVHLHTHSSTSNHSMRNKYRSAIYFFTEEDKIKAEQIIIKLQADFDKKIITQVLPFVSFKASLPEYKNYYYADPVKPFCTLYIHPKLQLLRNKFAKLAASNIAIE